MSQATVAQAVGWSQQHYSRFEANRVLNASLVNFATIASLVGLEPSLTFHRVGVALRDKGHEALIGRLLSLLGPVWHIAREVPFPGPGDPRSWDVLLRLHAQRVGVEAETRIRDIQALVRRMRERARDGAADAILIVLSDSATNRQLVGELRHALGRDFAAPPAHLLAALRTGRPVPGSGVILL